VSEDAEFLTAVAQRAEAAASTLFPGAAVSGLTPLAGGHSGLTLRARIEYSSGDPRDVVLKLAPRGRAPQGRHDVLRQARLLEALGAVPDVVVPGVLFTADGDPPFFAMEYVEGEAIEPVLDANQLAPAVVTDRARGAARILAALHRPAPTDLGLADEPVLSPEDELDRWSRTMNAVDAGLRPNGGMLEELLRAHVPEPMDPTVVHGDFRLGNMLCAGSEPTAVIDWEIWSIGDARVDLAWFTLFADRDNFPGASEDAPGMPTADELVAIYEATTGEAVAAREWFDAFARYKMAAIMGHNLRRHREGRHDDPYQERLVPTILSMVDRGIETLNRGA
jgi:aminoglycoside phosphotransferase (APT) family kinase protein